MMNKGSIIVLASALVFGADAFSPEVSRRQSLQALVGGVATAVVPSVVSLLPANADDDVVPSTNTVADDERKQEPAVEVKGEPVAEVKEEPVVEVKAYKSSLSEETPRRVTRMGGLLEAFQDGPRSIKMMVPSGWNKFEGEVGAYDIKWSDLVDKSENIKISSTPVKSTSTSIDILGEVQAVGVSLAGKRNAKLISATERLTDGILFYKFDFSINDGTHQLLQLCICKGKLWSIDASSTEKRWPKRSELYENVFGSFMPKLA